MNEPRRNRVYKSLHKPLTYMGIERSLFIMAGTAAMTMFQVSHSMLAGLAVFAGCTQHIDFTQPTMMVKQFPIIMTLIFICIFILTKIPAMVTQIFSGSTGGYDGGTGLLTGLFLCR